MPIAAMSLAFKLALCSASTATINCVSQISLASCSTQPDCGKYCVNSFCAAEIISPLLLKIIARLLVVPWSKAKMYVVIS